MATIFQFAITVLLPIPIDPFELQKFFLDKFLHLIDWRGRIIKTKVVTQILRFSRLCIQSNWYH